MNISPIVSYSNLSSQSKYCSFKGRNANEGKASKILDKTKDTLNTLISPKNHKETKTTLTVLSVISGLGAAASLLAGKKQAWLGPILGAIATIFVAKTAYDMDVHNVNANNNAKNETPVSLVSGKAVTFPSMLTKQ